MKPVRMYTSGCCPYCQMAKRLLGGKGVHSITELAIDTTPGLREEMMRITERRTVPQIFIGETHVGGFDDLLALDRRGGLLPLLAD